MAIKKTPNKSNQQREKYDVKKSNFKYWKPLVFSQINRWKRIKAVKRDPNNLFNLINPIFVEIEIESQITWKNTIK